MANDILKEVEITVEMVQSTRLAILRLVEAMLTPSVVVEALRVGLTPARSPLRAPPIGERATVTPEMIEAGLARIVDPEGPWIPRALLADIYQAMAVRRPD